MSDVGGVESIVTGNYFDKYRSKNIVHRLLMKQYFSAADAMLKQIDFGSILEIGCGPGDLAGRLLNSRADSYVGLDICDKQVAIARQRYPNFTFAVSSAYSIPAEYKNRDLVMACEVLEHLEHPRLALTEMVEATNKWLLVSVPCEPLWRVLNVLRGKYWNRLGNTPGHVQHFSRRGIASLVRSRLQIVAIKSPLPWTMILARK